ncbi:MAG: PAS domain S-box protein [Methanomassiliicoccales archaeon]|nr:PAS domain S-box protein [Methanomassiliicoccales archaeon]
MSGGTESAKILMVGGDEVVLGTSAAHMGFKYALDVQMADSAAEALKKLVSQDYEAIVLVHKEPYFDGIEFTKKVRESGYQTPIIVYSSDRKEETILRALGSGANFYLRRDSSTEAEFAVLFSLINESMARHRAEEAIAHNARRFSMLIQNMSELVLVLDDDLLIRYVSPSVGKILGYETEELMGRSFLTLLPEGRRSKWRATVTSHKDEPPSSWREEVCIRSKGGSWAVLDSIASVFVTDDGHETLINARDITGKKNQEMLVERTNALLRTIANIHQRCLRNSCPDDMLRGICEEFVDGGCFEYAWVALLDDEKRFSSITEAGLGPRVDPILDRFEREDPPACCTKALNSPELFRVNDPSSCGNCPLATTVCCNGTFSSRLSHGEEHFGILTLGVPKGYVDREEERILIASVIEDTSFAMHDCSLQRQLISSEQRYKAIFENTGTAMVIDDEEMRVILVNTEFSKLTGYSKSELENDMSWMELIHEEDFDKFKSLHRTVVDNSEEAQRSCEFRLVTKDGSVKEVWGFADLIPGTGKGVATVFDLTDQKRMEQTLRSQIKTQDEVLESMIGGIKVMGRPIKYK